MDINLKGPFFLIQALLPLLANPSSVILCGSVSAHIGLPQSSAYAASKSRFAVAGQNACPVSCTRAAFALTASAPARPETPALGSWGWRKLMNRHYATISAR